FSSSPVCGNLDEPAWIILLIIKLFLNSNQNKVKSIKFTEFNRGANPDMNPVKVHIHVNRNNLGFEDIEDVDPAQTITLTASDLQENSDPIDLYYVKFQRVKSLTFYIEDNAGGDVTAVGGLQIMGRTVATTNMNDFKKQG
ncbi:hypothetical protein ACHAXS_002937, partial [Conticribra weissflogii]